MTSPPCMVLERYSLTTDSQGTSPALLTDPAWSPLAIRCCLTHPHHSCSLCGHTRSCDPWSPSSSWHADPHLLQFLASLIPVLTNPSSGSGAGSLALIHEHRIQGKQNQNLIRLSAGHDQPVVLQNQPHTGDQPFLSPCPSVFSNLFLPKSPKSVPFPAFVSSPKYPIGSLTQSMCPVTLENGVSAWRVLQRCFLLICVTPGQWGGGFHSTVLRGTPSRCVFACCGAAETGF